jgi:hypothetical protein
MPDGPLCSNDSRFSLIAKTRLDSPTFLLCGVVFLAGPTWYMLNTLTDSVSRT